jgi:hypothetical protein
MVIGLFPSADAAGQCITNLEEADFSPGAISIVMRTAREAADLADVSGPLAGTRVDQLAARLTALGLPPSAAAAYEDGIQRGGVFIAVAAGAASAAAREMLQDARATDVREIGPA